MASNDVNADPAVEESEHHGRFFAVDRRCVEDATRYGDGITAAVAYITLARFTGRDQVATLAGMTAIHTRTGLTRGRADLGLKTLERAGLVTPSGTENDRRHLKPWGLVQADRAKLTPRQQKILLRLLSKKEPITSRADPDHRIASTLVRKGILEPTKALPGKPCFRLIAPEWVWLPNTLVDGFGTGDSPLARIRQIQDRRAVLVLLDCYRLGNLAEDGGLPWHYVRQTFKRKDIYTRGHFTVWGFVAGGSTAQWDPLFTRFKAKDQDAANRDLWRIFHALRDAGLVEYVGHIVEGLNEGAQALHAYALPYTGEEPERAVALAAHKAGRMMISEKKYQEAKAALGVDPWLCPVRSHIKNVELIGIVRPVHRPHTRMTSAWNRNFLSQCADHRALFESLAQSAAASAA
jgi:DNA-binding MarR family transcriptional regulator